MKSIFYYTDICMLLSKEEKELEKISRCLDIFEESKDSIHIVWGMYSNTKKSLSDLNPKVAKAFEGLLENFRKRELGDIVETDDLKGEMMKCDAYYGDINELLYYAKQNQMPIMIANIDV